MALVVAVTEAGSPIADQDKLSMLGTTLYEMLGAGDAVVANEMVGTSVDTQGPWCVSTVRVWLCLAA